MMSWSLWYQHLKRICVIYLITLIFILLMSYFLPYSKLFKTFHSEDEMLARAKMLNTDRLNKAFSYFRGINRDASKHFYNQHNEEMLDLLVVIVTVRRKTADLQMLGYFLQAAAAMDRLLKTDQNFEKKKLILCNVDLFPANHTDVTWASEFIPVIQRYNNSKMDFEKTSDSGRKMLYERLKHGSRYEKETVDYMFCLESAYLMNSKYILVMEDDTLPHTNALKIVKHRLDGKFHHHHTEFGYIKLYYPQRWQGFAFEETRIMELISLSLIGGGVFVLILSIPGCKTRLHFIHYLYFVAGVIYFILVAELLDRQNLMELRRISASLFSFKTSPGCCTQAMLYSTKIVPSLLTYLQSNVKPGADHTDILIYKFTTENNVRAFQIEPNLFYHIGLFTSLLDNSHKNPEEFLFSV